MARVETSSDIPLADPRWYGAASRHVAWFLHQLRCLPASMWIAATEREDRTETEPLIRALREQEDYEARRRLRDALAAMPTVADRIRRRISADLAVFEGIVPAPAVRRMRRVAHLAAFALAAWPKLSREDLLRLYRPFANLIPPPPGLLTE